MTNFAEHIIELFGLPENPKTDDIPRDTILSWMETDDIQTMGVLDGYIGSHEYYHRIKPNLGFVDQHYFYLRYFKRCIIENPDIEWVDTRFEAGYNLTNWFNAAWKYDAIPEKEKHMKEIKDLLSELIHLNNEEISYAEKQQCQVSTSDKMR